MKAIQVVPIHKHQDGLADSCVHELKPSCPGAITHASRRLQHDSPPLGAWTRKGAVTVTRLPSTKRESALSVFRALLWLVLAALHIFCAVFYGCSAYVYDRFESTELSIQLASFQLSIDPRYFPVITVFYGASASCHLVCLFEMVVRSVISRELVFHRTQKTSQTIDLLVSKSFGDKYKRSLAALAQWPSDSHFSSTVRLQSFVSKAGILWENSFGYTGVFGVGGRYFSTIFLLRETLECVLQSFQAYQTSFNVPRVWFNRFGVIVVVINCWSTPILQYFFRKNPRLRLLLCLLVDVTLDAISSVGVTAILAAQYLPDYNTSTTNFDITTCWSNSLWYSFMLTEFRQLFVQSWFDFFTRVLFALTMLLSMDDVKMLASVADHRYIIRDDPESNSSRLWSKRVKNCIHVLIATWGFIILGLHIEASIGTNVPDCLVLLHPWVTAKPACSYMEINCVKRENPIRGLATELDEVWSPIEASMLMVLEIISCSDLHIPMSFRSFQGLNAFNLMGNVISEWGEATALTHTHHPQMHHLGFLYNNLSAYSNNSILPPGLMHTDFPKHLLDVFVCACGLADLPANLESIWSNAGMSLVLVGNIFTKVPDVVLLMNFRRLNLDLNLIQEIPVELLELKFLRWLSVLGNPIASFPQNAKTTWSLAIFNFGLTNVTRLPDWMTTAEFLNQVVMYGSQTPLCLDKLAAGSSLRSYLNCDDPPILILAQVKDKRA